MNDKSNETFEQTMIEISTNGIYNALSGANYKHPEFFGYDKDGNILMRAHHITDLNWVKESPIQWLVDGVLRNYGPDTFDYKPEPDFLSKALKIYEALLDNPKTRVKLIADKGCICRIPECDIYGCGSVFAEDDKRIMNKYDLKENEVYTIEELLSIVPEGKEFYKIPKIAIKD